MAEVLTDTSASGRDSTLETPKLNLWQRLYFLLDQHSGRLLLAGICLYVIVFSVASFYKYETYQTGYDQIYFEQPLWNTSNGRFMQQSDFAYSTSAFAVDWMPLLVLFTPIYWLLPSPHTLFFVETLILGLGALPLFWLARDKFKSRPVGLLFAAVYLLNPTLEYFNLLPFNLRAPGLVALIYAFYFFNRGARWRFALFALLAIATRTEVSLVIAMFGVYGLLNWKRINWKLWVPPLVIGPVYFVIVFSFILPAFITPGTMVVPPETQPIQITQFQRDYISNTDTIISTTYGDLGKNLPDVIKNTLTNPLKTAQRIFTVQKFQYLILMLLPFAFLPLFAPRILLFALPIVAINLLSSRSTQFDYKSHYSAILLFSLSVGAIFGAYNLLNILKKWRFTSNLKVGRLPLASLGAILAVLVVFALGVQVLERNPLPGVVRNAEKKAMITPTNALISRIPANASVSTGSLLGPHLLPRQYIYPFPLALYSPPPQAVEYILIDTNAVALYDKQNGKAFSLNPNDASTLQRPIDWLNTTKDYKLVDFVEVKGQRDPDGKTRQIQLWQRVGSNVPQYSKTSGS